MKFRITATSAHNQDKSELLGKYPFLADYEIEDKGDGVCLISLYELNDLLDLIAFVDSGYGEIIITTLYPYNKEMREKLREKYGVEGEIEIYDAYRE